MKRTALNFTFFVLFLLVTAAVWASGGSSGHAIEGPGKAFIYTLINFTILSLGLYFGLKKHIVTFFRDRALTTQVTMEKAQKNYAETQQKLTEIETRLKNADKEGKNLIQAIKDESEAERQNMVKSAREMAERLQSDTQKIAEQEVRRAKELLKAEAVRVALELAGDEVKSQLTSEKQKKLSGEFVTLIQKAGAP